jgi:AcrR family transcriptional regulator
MTTSATVPRTRDPRGSHRLTADERRATIVEAAVTAFAEGGLAGTSTEDIARIAGVSQPYLFRLFGTKRDLFIAAVGRCFDRMADAFDAAAAQEASLGPEDFPLGMPAGADDYPAVMKAMGHAYKELLRDKTLLRLQLHAFAACGDPEVRAYVRERFGALVEHAAALTGITGDALRGFVAEGMLLNVASATDMTTGHPAWALLCDWRSD